MSSYNFKETKVMHFVVFPFSNHKRMDDVTGGGEIEAIRGYWIRSKTDQQLVHKSEKAALETV